MGAPSPQEFSERLGRNISVLETTSFVIEETALKCQDDKLFGVFHILRDVIDDLKRLQTDMLEP